MKFHLQTAGTLLVTASGEGWIRVNADEHRANLVLTPDAVFPGWANAGFDALTEADYATLLEHRPEIVLLGTGPTLRFPHPRLLRAVHQAQVGVESMDTRAACRTFNFLTGEGRRVVAALIV